MKIRATQLLQLEQFPDQQAWIGKLIGPVNDFMRQAIQILNSGLTFTDQFVGKDIIFSFTYESESVTWPRALQWTLASKPVALTVISATEDLTPIMLSVAWKYTPEGAVQITSAVKFTSAPAVSLLNAGSKYQIRCRVTP